MQTNFGSTIMTFTNDQLNALNEFRDFLNNDDHIFILKGYAGTGKTTIVKEFINCACEEDWKCLLTAPTGRAALILESKTGHEASTIHRAIYGRDLVYINDGNENEESVTHYQFPLKTKEFESKTVIFVDEASMISSRKNKSELFQFGSGVLLQDLLTFADFEEGENKVVFVGDPAQLPPVGDNRSYALSSEYLMSEGYKVSEVEMTEVVRQSAMNAIFRNAIQVRNLLKANKRNTLQMEFKENEFMNIDEWDIVTKYTSMSPHPGFESPVVICWTNKDAANYNTFIRRLYHKSSIEEPIVGDRVIVIANNYHNPRDIFNGEFAMIRSVSSTTTTLSAPVYCDENGEIQKRIIPLTYREVTLLFDDGAIVTSYIIEDLLKNDKRDLTYEETCSAYINFKMRHNGLKPGTLEFKAALETDPYLNALRIKFGYAITGHKSQGGEWTKVFVDFKGRCSLKNEPLRWTYTAITRARECLYAANIPDIDPFSKLKISKPQKRGAIPEGAFSYGEVPVTPYHDSSIAPALRAQYLSIESALQEKGYKIRSVQSFPYRERYSIESPDGTIYTCDGQYNKGMKLKFKPSGSEEIYRIINNAKSKFIKVDYTPSSESLKSLHDCISGICNENEICITNIEEDLDQYNIIYHLQTLSGTSSVKIFWDKDGFFTNTMISADVVDDDRLATFINELSEI